MLFEIDKTKCTEDGIGLIQPDGTMLLQKTKWIGKEKGPAFDKDGNAIPGDTVKTDGPVGMRYLTTVHDSVALQATVELLNRINGPGTAVYQPYPNLPSNGTLYVCEEGTGTPEARRQLKAQVHAMTSLGYHRPELVAQVMPEVSKRFQSAYAENPRGVTLWTTLLGKHPYDLQLPEEHLEPDIRDEFYEVYSQLFAVEKRDVPQHGEQYLIGHAVSGDNEIWAQRLCNALNLVNHAPIFHFMPSSENSMSGYIYADERFGMAEGQWAFLDAAFIRNDPAIREEVARLMPDQAMQAEFMANPTHNNLWIGLTGYDPRDWDRIAREIEPMEITDVSDLDDDAR